MDEQPERLQLQFSGTIWYWKGPAPHYFLTVPEAQSAELKAVAAFVSYGWGMIPVQARIGKTRFTTSLFHKDGAYVLPIKASVRTAEGVHEGDDATAHIEVEVRG